MTIWALIILISQQFIGEIHTHTWSIVKVTATKEATIVWRGP